MGSSAAPAVPCLHHVQRDAIGICVGCGARLCSECITKIEGINYCAECLPKLEAEEGSAQRAASAPISGLGRAASAIALGLWLTALSWAYLELAFPG
jgi:hypothetical protein